ncbi:hypothetical protein ANN_26316 [Periplaneta americana]|uniref:Uncharacterized protein n=1 Tax=Periplaneta americana TaxID=6978 RepID=A0ABQ8S5J7_PERAM|nr:hypothetical protein ANN_26316 [Periplaneta americana]
MSIRELKILHDFHAPYSIEQQRRVVRLPRKDVTFPNNFQNIERRLASLEKRLDKNDYEEQMLDYIRKGHVEVALDEDQEETFYLPHHLIKEERRGNVKCRIVFYGSSHEGNARSLNDILEV